MLDVSLCVSLYLYFFLRVCGVVWYGMVNVDLYSTIVTKVSYVCM